MELKNLIIQVKSLRGSCDADGLAAIDAIRASLDTMVSAHEDMEVELAVNDV